MLTCSHPNDLLTDNSLEAGEDPEPSNCAAFVDLKNSFINFKLSQEELESKSVDLLSDRSFNNFSLQESCEIETTTRNNLMENSMA